MLYFIELMVSELELELYGYKNARTFVIFTEAVDLLFCNENIDELVNSEVMLKNNVTLNNSLLLDYNYDCDCSDDVIVAIYEKYYRESYLNYSLKAKNYSDVIYNILAIRNYKLNTLEDFILYIIKMMTSRDCLLSLIINNDVCHITRYPTEMHIICVFNISTNILTFPYISPINLKQLSRTTIQHFVNKYGQLVLK